MGMDVPLPAQYKLTTPVLGELPQLHLYALSLVLS